jgi:excisionase family DNA binding protein
MGTVTARAAALVHAGTDRWESSDRDSGRQPSDIVLALVASLDRETLRLLAGRLSPYLPMASDQSDDDVDLDADRDPVDRWLDSRQAAAYLGMSVHAIHKLTAARTIPFEQDAPGCKCWFKRSELDRWRRGARSRSGEAHATRGGLSNSAS